MLTFTDIAIIAFRLFLETIAFYNAKMMYSYSTRISPLLTLYITHSTGTFLFLYDLYKHRNRYPAYIKKDLGISLGMMLMHVAYLSLFYNLCHIPKFYAMNCMSDVSIVSIYGASVLCTYIFSVCVMDTSVDKTGVMALLIGIIGVFFLLLRDLSLGKYIVLCSWVVGSSILSGLYGVLFKLSMNPCLSTVNKDEHKKKLENQQKQSNINLENKEDKILYNSRINFHIKEPNLNFYEYDEKLDSSVETSSGNIIDKKLKIKEDENINLNVKTLIKGFNESSFANIVKNKDIGINDDEPASMQELLTKKEITGETKQKLLFMRHYMGLTGLVTFLFYWPGLYFVRYTIDETMNFPYSSRSIIHLAIATMVSLSHNLVYFMIVAARTPLFAQVSGIILQPTFLFISIVKNKGLSCVTELTGCILTFISYLMLSDRH
ncbi:hypothetical protein COBT_001990 [Conglomerata obtusa]